MATVVTAEQRKDPSLAGWVASKDKENATAQPMSADQANYGAAANKFTTNNWGPTGTANGKTESQNLAAVIQQPGNTTKTTATPYIAPNGQTDYHISGQPVAAQTATPAGGGFNNPNTAGETPTPVNTPVAATSTPQQSQSQPSQGGYPGQLTTAQIQAEAQARIDKQRAALMNAVTGAKTGLKNTYDYTQGLQKDNRVLEDAQLQRTLNPFSGGTDYKTAMLSRDRQIADTASSKDYNNVIAGYDQQVASFDTLAPEQQNALIDELTRQERQYGLDVGSLTGQFNGGQTLAAKTADQNYQLGLSGLSGQLPNGGGQTMQGKAADLNNAGQSLQNQLAQLKLDDYPAESQNAAKLVQQQLTNGQLTNEAAKYNLDQLKDPNSPTNQAAKMDLDMKKIDSSNYSQEAKLKLEQLQKTIAEIGKVHKAPQSEADIEADKVKLAVAKKQLEDIAKGIYPSDKTPTPSATDVKQNTQSQYVTGFDSLTPEKRKLAFTNEKSAIIDDLGIAGYNALYSMYFDQYGDPIETN